MHASVRAHTHAHDAHTHTLGRMGDFKIILIYMSMLQYEIQNKAEHTNHNNNNLEMCRTKKLQSNYNRTSDVCMYVCMYHMC